MDRAVEGSLADQLRRLRGCEQLDYQAGASGLNIAVIAADNHAVVGVGGVMAGQHVEPHQTCVINTAPLPAVPPIKFILAIKNSNNEIQVRR